MSTKAKDWQFRVNDIHDCIIKIEEYIDEVTFDDFKNNEMMVDAVIRKLEVIGEAAAHIPDEIKEQYPDIPWRTMKGIRNILIHEYFGVDNQIIWETVQKDLPDLKDKIIALTTEIKSKS